MTTQPVRTRKLDQLPDAARERIDQLRGLFIERSKGHLTQIRQLLADRLEVSDHQTVDAELIALLHSLVGASGIFGYQELGEAAFRLENTLREANHSKTEFDQATADLIAHLNGLELQA